MASSPPPPPPSSFHPKGKKCGFYLGSDLGQPTHSGLSSGTLPVWKLQVPHSLDSISPWTVSNAMFWGAPGFYKASQGPLQKGAGCQVTSSALVIGVSLLYVLKVGDFIRGRETCSPRNLPLEFHDLFIFVTGQIGSYRPVVPAPGWS